MQNPIKHGFCRKGQVSKEYYIWTAMKQRCLNPNNKAYPNYGGRGITVCESWLNFSNFVHDMGPKPFPKAQIDRIDNNRGYEPANCRWTTSSSNCRNKNNNVVLSFMGEAMTMLEWSQRLGVAYDMLRYRHDLGWDDAKILTFKHRYLTKRKDYESIKASIFKLKTDGYSYNKIGKMLGFSHITIKKVWKAFEVEDASQEEA